MSGIARPTGGCDTDLCVLDAGTGLVLVAVFNCSLPGKQKFPTHEESRRQIRQNVNAIAFVYTR